MLELIYILCGVFIGAVVLWIAVGKALQSRVYEQSLELARLASQNAVLQERINGINEKHQEKLELLESNKEQLKLEFSEVAAKILESNSQKFSTQNQESLAKMITPIREQFSEFKKQIDDVYIKEAKERSMLQAEIKNIKEINHQMSQEAKNLTNALKGESKKQGVWGEMILESVLENSGLREGYEYEREVVLENETLGGRHRPDVIVHLPNSRDIIIDAKTSLSAYERFVSSSDESEKEQFLKEHILSMKKHIKELSEKEYTSLKGVKTVDFIFMFVPIESALLASFENDSSMFDHAFKKGIILVGPTTLMVSLRAVANSWKTEQQQKNAEEIAKRAGLLFDKFALFIDSMERLGKQMATAQKTYEETFSKMHSGVGSVTSQFAMLEKLGAAATKKLPKHLSSDDTK